MKTVLLTVVIALCLGAVALIGIRWMDTRNAPNVDGPTQPANESSDDEFRPDRLFETHFPPITEFEVVSASEVSDQIADAELVLGVVIAGEARAYPINMITGPRREFVNDTLGGQVIAPAW